MYRLCHILPPAPSWRLSVKKANFNRPTKTGVTKLIQLQKGTCRLIPRQGTKTLKNHNKFKKIFFSLFIACAL